MTETIIDMYARGVPMKVIARCLGLTPGQVLWRLRKSGTAFERAREIAARRTVLIARVERVERIKANARAA